MHAIHKGRLFLGNLRAARDKSLLQEHGITHVLSVVPAKAPFPKVVAHSQMKNYRKFTMHGCMVVVVRTLCTAWCRLKMNLVPRCLPTCAPASTL